MRERDFEGIVFRHKNTERAMASGIDVSVGLIKYAKAIERARRKIASRYRLALSGEVEEGDLVTYSKVWACNWLGDVTIQPKREIHPTEVEPLLYSYIVQRGGELAAATVKRRRQNFQAFGRSIEGLDIDLIGNSQFSRQPLEGTRRRGFLSTQDEGKRRAGGRRLLVAGLVGKFSRGGRVDHAGITSLLHKIAAEAMCVLCETPALDRSAGSCTCGGSLEYADSPYCPDSRDAAKRLLAQVEKCAGQCLICQEVLDPGSRRQKLGTGATLTDSAPQVDSLPLLRGFLVRIGQMDGALAQRPNATEDSALRYLQYNRQCLVHLGLAKLRDGVLTISSAGRGLLATKPSSAAERAFLLDRIRTTPAMARWRWFFEKPGAEPTWHPPLVAPATRPGEELLIRQFMQEGYLRSGRRLPMSRSTAERRARTLRNWRRYVGG